MAENRPGHPPRSRRRRTACARVATLSAALAVSAVGAAGAHTEASRRLSRPPVARRSIAGAPAPELALQPAVLALRDGVTDGRLVLHARDARGRPIDLDRRRVRFASSDPGLVQVDDDGAVHATGFGTARIEARVSGMRGTAVATVRAGVSRLDPPILYLESHGRSSAGRLRWLASNADGSPVELADERASWSCAGCGRAVAMDADGTLHALRPARSFLDVAVVRRTSGRGNDGDSALVVALLDPLPTAPVTLIGQRTVFFTPPALGGVDYLATWERFRASRVADLAHEILSELRGAPAGDGDPLVLAHGVGQTPELWQCGSASSPIWLGSLSLSAGLAKSCFVDPRTGAPAWGVFFHEMGHVFGPGSHRYSQGFAMTMSAADPYLSLYGEDFASLDATFVAAMLRSRARRYGLPRRIVRSVLRHWGVYWNDTETLDEYVAGGARYEDMPGGPGGIFRGIMWTLAREYGWGAIYRLYSIFLPPEAEFSFTAYTPAERATYFAAALSAATGDDLMARFRDRWGFPIDEELYGRMLREMVPAAALRDPVVDAGPDLAVAPGGTVALDDARASDWEGDPLHYRWRVIESPAGSHPLLRGARRLHPCFSADRTGEYLLSLTAGDDLLETTDSLRIQVMS